MSGAVMLLLAVVAARPVDAYAWISPDDYPVAALRENRGGDTGFRLRVSEEGRPLGCEIISSSGSKDLDATTCAKLMRRARFEPARDAGGRAMPAVYRNRNSWWAGEGRPPASHGSTVDMVMPLEKLPAGLERPARLDVAFLVAPDGSLSDCTPGPPDPAAKPRSKQGKAQRAAVELLGPQACAQASVGKLHPFVDDAGQAMPSIQVVRVAFTEGAPR